MLNEAATLARGTWFVGVIMFLIGYLDGQDSLIIAAGLAVASGVIGTAIIAHTLAMIGQPLAKPPADDEQERSQP